MPRKKDNWQDLCKLVEADDALPVRQCGTWTEEKLYFWNRYIDITTTSMVGKPQWKEGLVYVDLFAGPGICQLRDSKRRIPGSPLIAACAPKPFRSILLCEKSEELARACESRIETLAPQIKFTMFHGDCNSIISDIAMEIPRHALTLAFIDPEALDAKFETIQSLAQCGCIDLLILFADAFDIARNVVDVYLSDPQSKLDEFLGPDSGWRDEWYSQGNVAGAKLRVFFAKIYKSQLQRHLGYTVFGEKTIRSAQGPLYRLIYASKHPRGLDFWQKVTNKDLHGQKGWGWT